MGDESVHRCRGSVDSCPPGSEPAKETQQRPTSVFLLNIVHLSQALIVYRIAPSESSVSLHIINIGDCTGLFITDLARL